MKQTPSRNTRSKLDNQRLAFVVVSGDFSLEKSWCGPEQISGQTTAGSNPPIEVYPFSLFQPMYSARGKGGCGRSKSSATSPSARDVHEPPPFLSLQAPRGHQYFANFLNQGWEPQRGEKVQVRMRFVKKPGGKRGSWHAEFFPYETMQSQFMSEAEARAQGYRPTRSGQ